MNPVLGRITFTIGCIILILSLIPIPILVYNKEAIDSLIVDIIALLFSLIFLLLIIWEIKREVKKELLSS